MSILEKSVVHFILHTYELHEVDDCGSALPHPLLSDSHSLGSIH